MRKLLYYLRVLFLLVIFAVCIGLSVWYVSKIALSPTTPVDCYHCNVILISVDTLGAKHMGVYDDLVPTTPFLKELAETRAITFNHAYSNAPWTLPSHTSMFTGRYPWDIGMMSQISYLSEEIPTIFTALQDHGYETAAYSDGSFVNPIWGLTNGVSAFTGSVAFADWQDAPKIFTDASAWMTGRQSTSPFFLLIRPFEVHDPYGGSAGDSGAIGGDQIVNVNKGPGSPSQSDVDRFRSAYYQDIGSTDSALRSFFSALDVSPYAKNTVVIITSDHGEEFGEHGSAGMHGVTLYNEVIHVPLMVVLPKGKVRRVNQTVELRSLPSTILDILGYRTDNTFPGNSLVHIMEGRPDQNQMVVSATDITKEEFLKTYAVNEPKLNEDFFKKIVLKGRTLGPETPHLLSVIQGNLHLIRKSDGGMELYNIATDPDEKKNLYGTQESLTPEEAERLTRMVTAVTTGL
jgi:arylsulfatase A-like enzyme